MYIFWIEQKNTQQLLPIHGVHEGDDKAGSSLNHGQNGRNCCSLGLHDFCASLLDPLGECVQLVLGTVNLGVTLREQGNDRIPSVANDRHVDGSWIQTLPQTSSL